MLNSVNNPMEALDKANVDVGFLQKVKEYLNNPMYSFLLPMIGINKQVALQKIESLEKMMAGQSADTQTNDLKTSLPQSSQGDDLERFKKGLKSFK